MTEKEYIYLHIEAEKCKVLATCNGLPVISKVFNGKSIHSFPLNPFLTLKNQTQITVIPNDITDINTQIPEVKVKVKSYDKNTYSVSPETGNIIAQTELKGYTTQNLSFKNNILDFTSTFQKLPSIENEDEIKKFAIKLYQLFDSKNSNEIHRIFKPKLDDYSTGYYENSEQYSKGFLQFLQEQFFPLGVMKNNSEPILTSFIDKKIWRIGIIPDLEFIRSNPDDESVGFTIEIYIAKIDKELKIIR